jgi:hypothetical protein
MISNLIVLQEEEGFTQVVAWVLPRKMGSMILTMISNSKKKCMKL